MKKLLIVFSLLFTACLNEQNTVGESNSDGSDQFYYKRIEDGGPITGDENLILQCSDSIAGGFCESVCISEAMPEFKRYTLAMSSFEAAGKCFIYVFAFSSQDNTLPEVEYYVGDYNTRIESGSTTGFCDSVDIGSPDFTGLWQFADDNTNEYLNLYNDGNDLYKSLILQSNQGDIFTYFDADYADDITIQTRQGYGCRKKTEITNDLINSLSI